MATIPPMMIISRAITLPTAKQPCILVASWMFTAVRNATVTAKYRGSKFNHYKKKTFLNIFFSFQCLNSLFVLQLLGTFKSLLKYFDEDFF